ncbi:hypothetical protein CLU79DRAFT_738363 [Phycomyces nitens]|nr:hypothetical protein CLU79DRAFT_738363 [Phycomyces nitens]
MPSVDELKEAFAFAGNDIKARKNAVDHYALRDSEEWYYYTGLIILQKLGDQVNSNASKEPREPTQEESELMKSMEKHLADYEAKIKPKMYDFQNDKKYKELSTRYNVLIYVLDKKTSAQFLAKALCLDLSTAVQEQDQDQDQDQDIHSTEQGKKRLASVLSQKVIDSEELVWKNILEVRNQGQSVEIEYLSLPVLSHLIEKPLTDAQELAVLKKMLLYPQTPNPLGGQGIQFTQRFCNYFQRKDKKFLTDRVCYFSLDNLTISQMNIIKKSVPLILQCESFVTAYINKLVPLEYSTDSYTKKPKDFWDDGNTILEGYLTRLWNFVEDLPVMYQPLKALISFHKLRLEIVRENFSEEYLLKYLALTQGRRVDNVMSPIPGRKNDRKSRLSAASIINVPYLEKVVTTSNIEVQALYTYLTGVLTKNPEMSLDPILEYIDLDSNIKKLYATVQLTHPLRQGVASEWSSSLSSSELDTLVSQVKLEFTPSTTRLGRVLLADTPIQLDLQLKQVEHLTVRIYPVDLYNYWRIHPNKRALTITKEESARLDGLCPLWEKTIDFTDKTPLCTWKETFVFGKNHLGSDHVQGRGAWIIDFVGGKMQCRAIIQRGHLRHLIQDTSAGHLIQIIDENNIPLKQNSRVWYADSYYEPDVNGNILIPYRASEPKDTEILLLSSDGFCEPVKFIHKTETYKLSAEFYVNPESLLVNKQSKVVVVPRLTIYDQPASLDLLEKVTLTVTATSTKGVKSSTTSQFNCLSNNKSFDYEFTVPDLLSKVQLNLTAKVKSTSSQADSQDVEVNKVIGITTDDSSLEKPYLRINDRNEYYISVLGKNGEPHKNKEFNIEFEHNMISSSITTQLQTDEQGLIHLGLLEDINSISVSSPDSNAEHWDILEGSDAVLPTAFNGTADTPLKIPVAVGKKRVCSLYQTGGKEQILHDFTDRLVNENGYLKIIGLPEGRFTLYIYSPKKRMEKIILWIFNAKVSSDLAACGSYWSNWILGYSFYAANSPWFTQCPLLISQTILTDRSIVISLDGWTKGKTYALVTTTAFIEETKSLTKNLVDLGMSDPIKYYRNLDTRAVYITGRKLSDEYQYILKRARTEKWVGSSLAKPSLLIYPEVSASATSDYSIVKEIEKDNAVVENVMYRNMRKFNGGAMRTIGHAKSRDYGFLDHHYSILCLEPNNNGDIVIDRTLLGNGNILQLAVLSGEQVVTKEMVLDNGSAQLHLKNRCQTIDESNSEKAFVREKSVSTLCPTDIVGALQGDQAACVSMELGGGQQEFEVVDSFEKLFDIFKTLSNPSINEKLNNFEFLLTWPSFSLKKKLDLHNSYSCHELNLWLKHKDTQFFEQHIKPFIKSKIHKSFMDSYLVDDSLHEYAESLYLYNRLNIVEKALLAKRVPDHLDSILRYFEDKCTPVNELFEDKVFDTVMSSNALNQQKGFQPEQQAMFRGLAQGQAQLQAQAQAQAQAQYCYPSAAFGFAGGAPSMACKSSLQQIEETTVQAEDESDDDCGYDLFGNSEIQDRTEVVETCVSDAVDNIMDEDDDMEEDEDQKKQDEDALRARSASQQVKVPYSFVKPTNEWKEKGYYKALSTFGMSSNQFWIDYIKSKRPGFLSRNFFMTTNNFTEIMVALSVLDLPYAIDSQWKYKSDSNSGSLVITSATPCIVFHRTLKTTESTAPVNPTILLGQGLFSKLDSQNMGANMNIVDPSELKTATEYCWNLAVSNISPISRKCEATLQIPSGALPTAGTPYCQSKIITLSPYSTWQQVVGSFYFPKAGDFTQLPVTLTDSSALLNKSPAISILVSESSIHTKQTGTSNIPWTVVASKMQNEDVLNYLAQCKNLDDLNLNLIGWRMSNKLFARKVFDILGGQRRYQTTDLWQYALTHGFMDIIGQLIQLDSSGKVMPYIGKAFVSPLLCTSILDADSISVLDFYPIISARAHSLGTKVEVLNTRFLSQYNAFLEYLCDKAAHTTSDLLVLGVYLLLQDRIGECQDVYKRIQQDISGKTSSLGDTLSEPNVQLDYLGAYLQTRLLESQVSKNPESIDLNGVREIARKYRTCGNLRWRALFASLEDFVDEVDGMISNEDHADANITTERRKERALHTEPVLDMEVNEKDGLVVHYANMTNIQVNYYKTNVEVVFSGSPFMVNDAKQSGRQQGSAHSLEYGWVKPNYTETHILEDTIDCVMEETQEIQDFDMIGVNRIKMKTKIIPLPAHLIRTNVIVEVTGNGLRRSQTYFAHQLAVHIVEPFGVVRVAHKQTKRPLAGVYVKVYCRRNGSNETEFWKDGYTGLNGVFDYVSVTEGNALVGASQYSYEQEALSDLIKKISKFSILITSEQDGAVVKEAFPPS